MVVAQWLVALQWELLIMVVALQWELLIMGVALQWLLLNGVAHNGLLYNAWELLNDGCSALAFFGHVLQALMCTVS